MLLHKKDSLINTEHNWDLGMSDRADPNCPVLNHHLVSRLEIVLFYIVGFRYILSCP